MRLDQARALSIEELRARRAMVAAARGRRRLRRTPPRQRLPRGQELRMRRALLGIVNRVEELVVERLLPLVERLAPQVQATRPDALERRVDAPADDISDAIDDIRAQLSSTILSDDALRRAAAAIGEDVANFNREQLSLLFERTVGVGLPDVEPGLTDVLRGFVRDNARLIRNLGTQALEQIEGSVLRGFRRGLSNRQIAAEVRERIGVTRSRARLIARDQVASLNGELTQVRQRRMGVREYIWRTVGDERVRDAHEALDGRRFSWDDPPPEGHPGEPINCRCIAEPVLDPIFEGL